MRLYDWFRYKAIPWYTTLGIAPRTVTLEMLGRKSGQPQRVSVSRTDYDGQSYFVALYSEAQWVKNLRAAEGRAVILSRGRHPVQLEEIPVEARPPILLAYVQTRTFSHSGPQSARLFFGLGPHPTLEEMQALADRYPVFRIQPIRG